MEERHFDQELKELKKALIDMASIVEAMTHKSVQALKERNASLAKELIPEDEKVNQYEIEIEERCVTLLALRQPVGSDLRFIVSAIKINNDLERMGDHAVNIAECALSLMQEPLLKPLIDIPRMAEAAMKMLHESIESFVKRDAIEAKQVCEQDDEVDNLRDQVFRELLTFMIENPKTISRAMELILVARNLERIADLSTNIAEEAIFMSEARVIKHHAEEKKC
ncbi:MAG: phosphate signaling complex protein PhoU [Candidatus Edwardsbacteria bacterium]